MCKQEQCTTRHVRRMRQRVCLIWWFIEILGRHIVALITPHNKWFMRAQLCARVRPGLARLFRLGSSRERERDRVGERGVWKECSVPFDLASHSHRTSCALITNWLLRLRQENHINTKCRNYAFYDASQSASESASAWELMSASVSHSHSDSDSGSGSNSATYSVSVSSYCFGDELW